MNEEQYIHFYIEGNDCLWVTPLDSSVDFRQPEALPELQELQRKITQDGLKRVVVDLSAMPHFGSVVLEWIVSLWKLLRAHDGTLVLHGASEVGREVLQLVRFDKIWPIAETREDALRLVRENPPHNVDADE
jgi:anti-anti-sigma factor